MLLQEHLLRSALAEQDFDANAAKIQIDHKNGFNFVNGHKFNIKYPFRYRELAEAIPIDRKFKYVFSGHMSPEGGRKEMLEPFDGPESHIEKNDFGRKRSTKFGFNDDYYKLMRSGRFSLCPHQQDWRGPKKTAWTYRFIEAVFSRTLPICFRAAPCGPQFLEGFNVFWDDDAHTLDNYEHKVESNYALAGERFFFTPAEVALLKAGPTG
jgi:hypothetical protein